MAPQPFTLNVPDAALADLKTPRACPRPYLCGRRRRRISRRRLFDPPESTEEAFAGSCWPNG